MTLKLYKNTLIILTTVIFAASITQAQTKLNENGVKFINDLIAKMTLEEKLGQLVQSRWAWGDENKGKQDQFKKRIKDGTLGSFLGIQGVEITKELQQIAVEESRLHIPLLFAHDIIHGWRTTFPVPLAEAASWNPAAAEKSARVAAIEATANGLHWTFAPMVDIARDPRWGRITEGSGEDPYLGSLMAAARVKGFQGDDISAVNTLLACAKHFCAYGAAEGGRDYNIANISQQALWEIYLPPFKAAVDAGVETFMGSFNEVNGVPMHANDYLINNVLRKQWGFNGVLISDFTAVMELQRHGVAANPADAGVLALNSGVDIDMVSDIYFTELPAVVKNGRLQEETVNKAVFRVLRLKYILGLFDDPYRYNNQQREKENILTPDHRKKAREVARESIVLLKNDNEILPLSKDIKKLTVIGALATDDYSPLGAWHVNGHKEDVVTILQGLKNRLGENTEILYEAAYNPEDFSALENRDKRALELAKKSDAVLLVIGETSRMSGEASNRSDVGLPGDQIALIKQFKNIGKPVIVLLMNGRPLALPWVAEEMPVILESWFLGVEMGNAVADVLFGDYNPSGKLPVTFPRVTGQIPIYYNHKNTGRPPVESDHFTSKYLDVSWTPQYPFGYGLSYTRFEISEPVLDKNKIASNDKIKVTVNVKNTGKYAGQEVAQMYIKDEVRSLTPPVKELKGFQKIFLNPGETKSVSFDISISDLKFYDSKLNHIAEPGWFTVFVGSNSQDVKSTRFELTR